jgi:hypothetical protein
VERRIQVFIGKHQIKRQFTGPWRLWVDIIKMDLQQVSCGSMDCIGFAEDKESWQAHVNAAMNLRVP